MYILCHFRLVISYWQGLHCFWWRHDLLWCRHDRCGETSRELPANISCQKTSARFSEDSDSTSRTHMSFLSSTIHPQSTIHQLRTPMKKLDVTMHQLQPAIMMSYCVHAPSPTQRIPGKFRLTCWVWRSPTHSDLKIYTDSLHLKL